jgi:hypothetical protein
MGDEDFARQDVEENVGTGLESVSFFLLFHRCRKLDNVVMNTIKLKPRPSGLEEGKERRQLRGQLRQDAARIVTFCVLLCMAIRTRALHFFKKEVGPQGRGEGRLEFWILGSWNGFYFGVFTFEKSLQKTIFEFRFFSLPL